jgi:hypothetical protein
VRELAATGARIRVPVAVTCRVLKLHRQHYYAWLACPVTDAEWVEAHRANVIFDAYRDDQSWATGSCWMRPVTPDSRWPRGPRGGS